jgi:hypothetical protein
VADVNPAEAIGRVRLPLGDGDQEIALIRRGDRTVLLAMSEVDSARIELTAQEAGQLAGALLALGAVEEPAVVTLPPEPRRSPC